jgi:hypothetical protein
LRLDCYTSFASLYATERLNENARKRRKERKTLYSRLPIHECHEFHSLSTQHRLMHPPLSTQNAEYPVPAETISGRFGGRTVSLPVCLFACLFVCLLTCLPCSREREREEKVWEGWSGYFAFLFWSGLPCLALLYFDFLRCLRMGDSAREARLISCMHFGLRFCQERERDCSRTKS